MKKTFFLIALIWVAGCTSYTRMNRITDSEPTFAQEGTIYVVSANKATNNSLEFKHFKPSIEQQLSLHGFTPVQSLKAASLVAVISYGIDNGKTKTITTPVYGYDTFNRYSVIIPGYPTPGYAMMGMNTVAYDEYTHVLSVEIIDAKTIKSSSRREVYSSKVISKNLCPFIAPVFPDLVRGLFTGFPASNGETKEVKVKTSQSCQNY